MDSAKATNEVSGVPALHRSSARAPARENICAVVVTYFPDAGFPGRLEQICRQVEHVVVVDNGSDPESYSHVAAAASGKRAAIIRNDANLGVARALNLGMRYARENGYAWALLFDQDTLAWSNTVDLLTENFTAIPDKEKIAVLGCNRFLKARSSANQAWAYSPAVITSGSMVSLEAAAVIGPFRDEFFIDCVDFEFCLRARSKGFQVVELLNPIMSHAIGNPQPVRLGWIRGRTSNHRPWRWYYMVRNNLLLIREYIWREPGWAFRTASMLCFSLSLSLIFEQSRLAKLRYLLLGLGDGVRRKFDRVII